MKIFKNMNVKYECYRFISLEILWCHKGRFCIKSWTFLFYSVRAFSKLLNDALFINIDQRNQVVYMKYCWKFLLFSLFFFSPISWKKITSKVAYFDMLHHKYGKNLNKSDINIWKKCVVCRLVNHFFFFLI